jgi:hypothetical protein
MADAEGRATDAHELNRQLADTIGAQVEQLLGISGYSEADNMKIDAAMEAARRATSTGQPGAGGGSTQEQPAGGGQPDPTGSAPAAVKPAPSSIDWNAARYPNGKILGKYDTEQQAVMGVANTVAMAKVAFSRAEEIERHNAELRREVETLRSRPAVAPTAASQASPEPAPSRGTERVPDAKLDTVLSKLHESGTLDAEDLRNLVSAISEHSMQEARRAAREELDQRTTAARAEAERWGRVEAFMAEKYPESMDFTDELALYTKTHPMIAAGVQALIAQDKHEQATEEAWKLYAQENKISPKFVPAPATKENVEREIRLDAADQVRREAVEQARKDAGIVGAGTGARGVHENVNAGPSEDEYNNAVAQLNQGDGRKWRALVFGDALNHPIFGS